MQGFAFQRAAAHARNVLLLYGSSELTAPIPDKASEFFRAAPTGFEWMDFELLLRVLEKVDFEKHDDDPTFLDWQHTHFTAKGWMFCNRVLDDFFHGRVSQGW